MRPASEVLRDLWILIERTELGARAAAGGRERWALNCARRAVSTNVEQLGPELPVLREALARADRWLPDRPDEELSRGVLASVEQAWRSVAERARRRPGAGRRALALSNAHMATEAVLRGVVCAASGKHHDRVAELARSSFSNQELEAAAQARRLLLFTKLLPRGADLLVRLDYAESIGKMPLAREEREWIEAQRSLLMANDEQARMAVLLRELELVFLPELERLR